LQFHLSRIEREFFVFATFSKSERKPCAFHGLGASPEEERAREDSNFKPSDP
jgi:hypothetical protein